jgi:hypothetical protein
MAPAEGPIAGSLGDLFRAHIGYADRAQKLLLATDSGVVELLVGGDSLAVFLFQLRELGLPGCFPNRFTLRIEIVSLATRAGHWAS